MVPSSRKRRRRDPATPLYGFLTILAIALVGLLAGASPAAADGGAQNGLLVGKAHRLLSRQTSSTLPNNTVECPTFRFTAPYLPTFSSPCSGGGSLISLQSGIVLVANASVALTNCQVGVNTVDITDTDGTTWLLNYDQTSSDFAALDQSFQLSNDGTTLLVDPVCGKKASEITFAQTVMSKRLLRLQLRCNSDAYVGFLYFRWAPTGTTPMPGNLTTFNCPRAVTSTFNWVNGTAYNLSSTTTTTVRISTTVRVSTTAGATSTSQTVAKTPTSTTAALTTAPVVAAALPTTTAGATTTGARTSTAAAAVAPTTTTTTTAYTPGPGLVSPSCPTFPAGTNPPGPGSLLNSFANGTFRYVATSKNIPGRTMLMYLGTDPTIAVCRGIPDTPANASDCEVRHVLTGSWRDLRVCTWKTGVEANGYLPMNNALRITWNDTFPGPLGQPNIVNSTLQWAIQVNLPTVVDLQADVAIVEDSGIRNFNLTGFFLTTTATGERALVLDYQMWSRWPNNLTYHIISSLPFTPAGPLKTLDLQGPDLSLCRKNPPDGPFTTDAECWQYGSIEIPLGSVCNISGPYVFDFDSNCFPGAGTSTCSGTTLRANALIEGIDLCGSLLATAGNVTGNLTVDKPNGYFFGDTVQLNATFKSPDVPLYETRLMSAEVVIVKYQPAAVPMYTQAEGAVLLGKNSNFTIDQDGLKNPYNVLMSLTPNMMPTFAEGAFLTTNDFDTANNQFTFRLRFRVFFDAVSAGRVSRRRRRGAFIDVDMDLPVDSKGHLLSRQAAPTVGSIQEVQVGAQSSMKVPNVTVALQNNPSMVPAGTQPTTPTQQTTQPTSQPIPGYVWAIVGVAAGVILLGCLGGLIWFLARKRKHDRRSGSPDFEHESLLAGASPFGKSPPPAYEMALSGKVPTWPGVAEPMGTVSGIPDVSSLFSPSVRTDPSASRLLPAYSDAVDVSGMFKQWS